VPRRCRAVCLSTAACVPTCLVLDLSRLFDALARPELLAWCPVVSFTLSPHGLVVPWWIARNLFGEEQPPLCRLHSTSRDTARMASEEMAVLKERLLDTESQLQAAQSHGAALVEEVAALRAELDAAIAAAATGEAAAAAAEGRAAELHKGLAEAQARVAEFQAKDVEVYTRIREAMEAAEEVRAFGSPSCPIGLRHDHRMRQMSSRTRGSVTTANL
jgi:hypothetical protein